MEFARERQDLKDVQKIGMRQIPRSGKQQCEMTLIRLASESEHAGRHGTTNRMRILRREK
jgi:hypothetical protein